MNSKPKTAKKMQKSKPLNESSSKALLLANFAALILVLLLPDADIKQEMLALLISSFFLSVSLVYFCDIEKGLDSLNLNLRLLKRGAAYGVAGFFGVFFSAVFLSYIFEASGSQIENPVGSILNDPILIFFAVFVSPISEELFFRGALYRFLKSKMGTFNSIVATSLIFALFHIGYLSLYEFIGAFIGGVIFALIFEKSKTISSTITAHFLVNLVSILTNLF